MDARPDDAPLATFCDIPRGGDLWVATEHPGRLAVREVESDELTPLAAEDRGEGRDRVLHADLSDLELPDGVEERLFDVMLVDETGEAHQVWVPPAATGSPTMPLPTHPMTRRFLLRRGPHGFLKVLLRREPPCVEVLGFTVTDQGIDLTLPGSASGEVQLVVEGRVLASFPVSSADDHHRATLVPDLLPDEDPGDPADVVLASEDRVVPLARHANGLEDAGPPVLLPDLYDRAGRPRLRLRFAKRGQLRARVVSADPRPRASRETA